MYQGVEHSGPFGFDRPSEEVTRAYLFLRKNPIFEAHQMFGNAITQYPFLLDAAAEEASRTTRRVLDSFKWWGSKAWEYFLGSREDILTNSNKKGVELVRLFLFTSEISYNEEIQERYRANRLKVVQAFVSSLSKFGASEMSEIYNKFGLRVNGDSGNFIRESSLRRVVH